MSNLFGGNEIKVRAGEPIKIDVPIDGSPTPTVSWTKDGKDLPSGPRVSVTILVSLMMRKCVSNAYIDMVLFITQCIQESGEEEAKVEIPVSKRGDTGKYKVKVANEFGEDEGEINVIVLGVYSLFIIVNKS